MEGNRKSIIYVDDIHFGLVTAKDRLRKHYEISVAQSVGKMFEIVEYFLDRRNTSPDLILLDLNMPEVDGYDAIKGLKRETRYAGIPIIVLSSKRDKKTMEMMMELGAADIVAKPFSDAHLIRRIEYQLDPDKKIKTNRSSLPSTTIPAY